MHGYQWAFSGQYPMDGCDWMVDPPPAATGAPDPEASAPLGRFRLNNLGPQPGSKKKNKRKGRGIAAGQGNSCGFGMRGQKSRSGPGVRKGFEGGQMPLYRRIPKLRGIAGAGCRLPRPLFLTREETERLPVRGERSRRRLRKKKGRRREKEEKKKRRRKNSSLARRRRPRVARSRNRFFSCARRRSVSPHGEKDRGDARAFSAAAKGKLEAAGCTLTALPGRKKWVKPSVAKNLARAEEYFAKKRAAAAGGGSDFAFTQLRVKSLPQVPYGVSPAEAW
ncbi:hypothetical protein BHM03_00016105 [Ensete ventricosum]|nr:hypothetical protein BHM03_00016105 [Ensete ventricosum]